jgi:hypothetical protein
MLGWAPTGVYRTKVNLAWADALLPNGHKMDPFPGRAEARTVT